MSTKIYPVCGPVPEAGSVRLFTPKPNEAEVLVCRAETPPDALETADYFGKWRAWQQEHRLEATHRWAADLFRSDPFAKGEKQGPSPWESSLLGAFAATVGGAAGCSGSVVNRPADAIMVQGATLMSGDFRGRYDLVGDPQKFGTILFYRQSYGAMPDMDNNLASLDGYEDTLQYQWHILKSLELLRPKHVFVEDLPIDFPPGDRAPLMKYIKEGLGDFKNFFSKYDLPSEREPQYLRLLAAYKQVALIYAYKYPDVHLHRTVEPAETAELHVRLEQLRIRYQANPSAMRKDPEFQKLMFELPEAYAVREIMKFYRQHPGETVALIFGKMNQFCDNFKAIHYLPRIASFWWGEPTDSVTIPKACE